MKQEFRKYRETGKRLTMLTAYDAGMAALLEKAGIDIILVGDSLGNVFQGASSTRVVTMEQMEYHIRAVRTGAPKTFIIGDMPHLSYETPEKALINARRLTAAGCDAVKLEGYDKGIVKAVTDAGIPVCAHIGLLPQTAETFKVRGKEDNEKIRFKADAEALREEGAFMVVIECTSSALAKEITETLSVPTIGIGAGNACDGQVLVINDLLGMKEEKGARFVRRYAELHTVITDAVKTYIRDVRDGNYPSEAESYR